MLSTRWLTPDLQTLQTYGPSRLYLPSQEAKKKIAEDNGKLLASKAKAAALLEAEREKFAQEAAKANAEMARIDNAKTQARKQALKTHQSQLREQIQVVNSAKAEINMTAGERALNQDRLGKLASMPDQQVFELLKDMPTKSPTKK